MKKLPIDLPLKTMTTKISVAAHERLKALAEKYDARISDVLSASLLHIEETKLERILADQKSAVDALPKSVKGVMRNAEKLTAEEREMIRKILE